MTEYYHTMCTHFPMIVPLVRSLVSFSLMAPLCVSSVTEADATGPFSCRVFRRLHSVGFSSASGHSTAMRVLANCGGHACFRTSPSRSFHLVWIVSPCMYTLMRICQSRLDARCGLDMGFTLEIQYFCSSYTAHTIRPKIMTSGERSGNSHPPHMKP